MQRISLSLVPLVHCRPMPLDGSWIALEPGEPETVRRLRRGFCPRNPTGGRLDCAVAPSRISAAEADTTAYVRFRAQTRKQGFFAGQRVVSYPFPRKMRPKRDEA